MFVLNFSHCNEARARSGKRDDIYEGDRKLSTRRRSPLRAKYFLDVWVKKECRERPPENDGWRVGAEEKKRKRGDGYGPSRWFVAYACCRRSSFIRLDDRCSTPKTDITLIDWRVDERAT